MRVMVNNEKEENDREKNNKTTTKKGDDWNCGKHCRASRSRKVHLLQAMKFWVKNGTA